MSAPTEAKLPEGLGKGITPGPWTIRKQTSPAHYEIRYETESPCPQIEHRQYNTSIVARVYEFGLCDEHGGNFESNARLIAAAPDLLAKVSTLEARVRELEEALREHETALSGVTDMNLRSRATELLEMTRRALGGAR